MAREVHAKYPIDLLSLKNRRLRRWRRVIPIVILIVPSAIIMTICYFLPVDEKLFFAILDTVLIIFAYVLGKQADRFSDSAKERLFYGPMVREAFNKLTAERYTLTKDDAEMLLQSASRIEFEDVLEDAFEEMPDFVEFGSVVKNVGDRRIRVTLIFDKRVGFYVLERKVPFQRRFNKPPAASRLTLEALRAKATSPKGKADAAKR